MVPDLNLSVSALALAFAGVLTSAEDDLDTLGEQLDALEDRVADLEAAGATPPVTIYLTLTGALSYAANAADGTTVFLIGNVPPGQTPAIASPNDGRVVVAGNAVDGWRGVKGAAASSAGSFDVTVTATGAVSVTKKVTVTAIATPAPAPTPAPSGNLPVLNSRFFDGQNVQAADYYNAAVIESDYGKSCGVSHYGYYGLIFVPFAGVNGLATWRTNAGITLQTRHPSIEVLSSDPNTGTHRVNVKYDATDTNERTVKYDGVKPEYITVTRDGVTGEFAPEALNAPLGAFMRNLDMGVQNGIDPNDTTRQDDAELTDASPFNEARRSNGDGFASLPFERQARFVAAKRAVDPGFLGILDVIPIDRTEQQLRNRFRYYRDHAGGAYYAFQCANEDPWNLNFQGVFRVIVEAFRHGFYGTGTHANPAPALNPYVMARYIGRGSTVSPATQAGGYVIFQIGGTGGILMRAKKDVPANAPVDDNEFWETIYGHTEVQNFGKQYQAHYLNRAIDIAKEEFGSRYDSEVVPVLMGQNGAAGSNGSVLGQFAPHRAFVPELWAKVRGFGWASYLDSGGADGYDYSTATAENWAYWIRYKAWPHLQAQLTKVQEEADQEGKIAILYEGGPAMSEGVRVSTNRALIDANIEYFKSDECALMSADYSSWLRLNFRGLAVYFTAVGSDSVEGSGLSVFGQRASFNDTTSKRYVGYQRGLTTDYTPRSTVPPAPSPAPAPSPTPSPTPTPAPAPTPAPTLSGALPATLAERWTVKTGISETTADGIVGKFVNGWTDSKSGKTGTPRPETYPRLIVDGWTTGIDAYQNAALNENIGGLTTNAMIGNDPFTVLIAYNSYDGARDMSLFGAVFGGVNFGVGQNKIYLNAQYRTAIVDAVISGGTGGKHTFGLRWDGGDYTLWFDGLKVANGHSAEQFNAGAYTIGVCPDGNGTDPLRGSFAVIGHATTAITDQEFSAWHDYETSEFPLA
jgi:hypothetical protein